MATDPNEDNMDDHLRADRSRMFASVLVVLFLGVGGLLGWLYYRSIPKTAQEQFARAESLEKELAQNRGKLEKDDVEKLEKKVLENYEKVFGEFTDEEFGPKAHRRIAKIHEEHKRFDEAIEWYIKLAEKYPKDEEAPADLERAAKLAEKELEDPRAARDIYLKLAEGFPDSDKAPDAMFRAAEILDQDIEDRTRDQIVEAYNEVVKKYPKSDRAPEALFRIGEIHEEASDWTKALEVYLRIENEYPETDWAPRAMRRRGDILEKQLKKPREAEEVFKKLIEKYPESKDAEYARQRAKAAGDEAAKQEVEDHLKRRYSGGGGSGGGTIYDQTSQWTDAKKKLYRKIAAQKLDYRTLSVNAKFEPDDKKATFETRIHLLHTAEKPHQELLFYMGDQFVVDKVTLAGSKVDHKHQEEQLVLFLDNPLEKDKAVDLVFTYTLDQSGSEMPPIYQIKIDETGFAMADVGWYPSNVFGDLFGFEATYEIPSDYKVVSLGEPTGSREVQGGTSYSWKSTREVFGLYWTYAKFVEEKAKWGEVDLRVLTFKKWKKSAEMLETVKKILEFYQSRFGAYPYKKLWIAEVDLAPLFSGVGPASLLFLNTMHFKKNEVPLTVTAHEISHQWWGNRVPIALFSTPGYSQWLSEGFATYSETMFMEHQDGKKKLREHLDKYRDLYFTITRSYHERPLSEELGGGPGYFAVVYMKGAWVLHTLRWQLGDEAFNKALAEYSKQFAWKGSTIEDFKKIASDVSGQDLTTFFEDWIGGIGGARFDIDEVRRKELPPEKDDPDKEDEKGKKEKQPTRWEISFDIKQRATKTWEKKKKDGEKEEKPAPPRAAFRSPFEVVVEGANKDQRHVVRLTLAMPKKRFTLVVPFQPTRVTIDPDGHWLKVPGNFNSHRFR